MVHYVFLCLYFQMQPLPEAKAMFYNQMTLKSLPEPERIRHRHGFKICKNFKVPSLIITVDNLF